MDFEHFKVLYERLTKNLSEIEELINIPDLLSKPEAPRVIEKIKYLFYSVTKSLVDLGHGIILEKDFRDPLNRADIFISLAEHDIILSSVVPGVKKAALALPKMNNYQPNEVIELVSNSMSDMKKCLDSFSVYFSLKDKKI